MNAEEVNGFEIGQSEPLTVRLRDLVRSYPKGISIFKELSRMPMMVVLNG
jgi:hypothetical protein